MPDLRQYARQTNVRLVLGALIILLVIGEGLIWIFYGGSTAILGLLCIGAGLIPVGIIVAILAIMEKIVQKQRGE